MLNHSQKEKQAIFKFDEVFYIKLKKHAKRNKVSMKSIIEKNIWPIIKDDITFEDEMELLKLDPTPDPELENIGIHIQDKEKRLKTDSRFAELASL